MSIIHESRNSKQRSRAFIVFTIIFLIGLLAFYFLYWRNRDTSSPDVVVEVPKIPFTVARQDLMVSINVDGKVSNEDAINLVFPTSDTKIQEIYVKEGDKVKKGDKIAKIDTKNLESGVRNAEASKAVAIANLDTKLKGGSDIDLELARKDIESAESKLQKTRYQNEISIKLAQLNVDTATKDLEDVKRDVQNSNTSLDLTVGDSGLSLEQTVESAIQSLNSILENINDSLETTDDILNERDAQNLLGNQRSRTLRDAEDSFDDTERLEREYWYSFPILPTTNQEYFVKNAFTKLVDVVESTKIMLDNMDELLNYTDTDDNFTSNDLDRMQSLISSLQNKIDSDKNSSLKTKQSIESAISNRDNKVTNTDFTVENNQNKITDAEDKLTTATIQLDKTIKDAQSSEKDGLLALDIAKTQYRQRTEGITDAETLSLKAQIDQAQVKLDQAIYDLELGTMTSPIDGEITALNGGAGDLLSEINNKPFAIVLNRNTFYVDIPIEEGDISKLKVGQKIYATFDASEGTKLDGQITTVAPIGAVDNNGIVSYNIRAVLTNLDSQIGEDGSLWLRSGMTANVDFIISESKNVLVVPVSSVKRVNNSPSVQMENGEWKTVKTGYTDGKMVEIISGLKEGDSVMSNK